MLLRITYIALLVHCTQNQKLDAGCTHTSLEISHRVLPNFGINASTRPHRINERLDLLVEHELNCCSDCFEEANNVRDLRFYVHDERDALYKNSLDLGLRKGVSIILSEKLTDGELTSVILADLSPATYALSSANLVCCCVTSSMDF